VITAGREHSSLLRDVAYCCDDPDVGVDVQEAVVELENAGGDDSLASHVPQQADGCQLTRSVITDRSAEPECTTVKALRYC